MRSLWFLNPLQWGFRVRTLITLITWAVVPMVVVGLTAWLRMREIVAALGYPAEHLQAIRIGVLGRVFLVAAVILALALVAAMIFARVVVGPLSQIQRGLKRIAAGDLTVESLPVTSRDEVGQITDSFNTMVAELRSLVALSSGAVTSLVRVTEELRGGVQEARVALDAAGGQISLVQVAAEELSQAAANGSQALIEVGEAANQVASAAQSQAEEVSRASERVQQMADAIGSVADSATVVAESAMTAHQAGNEGGKAVRLALDGITRVHERVVDAAGRMGELNDSLRQVDEILALITEIADQTNLLALNAAIEAARAGEAGRGFSVVADEVRRLAERVRVAAQDVGEHVVSIRHDAQSVVEAMRASTQEAEKGLALSEEAGAALDRIREAVIRTEQEAQSISAVAEQLSASSQEVVQSIVQLSAIAQENAATAEEMLAGADTVSAMIQTVNAQAQSGRETTASMVASVEQIRATIDQIVGLADQMGGTTAEVRQHTARFQLGDDTSEPAARPGAPAGQYRNDSRQG